MKSSTCNLAIVITTFRIRIFLNAEETVSWTGGLVKRWLILHVISQCAVHRSGCMEILVMVCLTKLPVVNHRMAVRWIIGKNVQGMDSSRVWSTTPEITWRVWIKPGNVTFFMYYVKGRDQNPKPSEAEIVIARTQMPLTADIVRVFLSKLASREKRSLPSARRSRGSVGALSNWNMDLFICLPSSRSLPWRTHKQKQAPSPWQLRSPQGLPLSYLLLYSHEKSYWRNLFCSWSGNWFNPV